MMEAILERCAGIDVGKKFVVVCVMTGGARDDPHTQIKKFSTIVSELQRLAEWLVAEACTHAVMESTGSYWKPVFNLLETHVRVILANAADVQNRRGHKTDPNDSRWLAHLLRHGMIRPSFIPPLVIRELRDLTRRRRQLIGENSRERNRVQNVLEDANVKLGDVLQEYDLATDRENYLVRHENSRYWVDFSDFGFFRLQPIDLYYVGGFRMKGWVGAGDYEHAAETRCRGRCRRTSAMPWW